MPQPSKTPKKKNKAEMKETDVALFGRYPDRLKEEAIAAVEARRLRNPRDRTIYREVADKFAVGEQSLRLWVKKNDADRFKNPDETGSSSGRVSGNSKEALQVTSKEIQIEFEKMRKQIEKLKAENEVLKRAFVVFSSEWGENS